jgi:hypothetical protein
VSAKKGGRAATGCTTRVATPYSSYPGTIVACCMSCMHHATHRSVVRTGGTFKLETPWPDSTKDTHLLTRRCDATDARRDASGKERSCVRYWADLFRDRGKFRREDASSRRPATKHPGVFYKSVEIEDTLPEVPLSNPNS